MLMKFKIFLVKQDEVDVFLSKIFYSNVEKCNAYKTVSLIQSNTNPNL